MENLREQQIEALEAVFEYNQKLIPALETITLELRGIQQEDTQEYLNHILKGVNWVIEVVNGTKSLINEEKEVINKEKVNEIIIELNRGIKEENNMLVADVIETGILPFIQDVSSAAKNIAGIEVN